MGILFDMNLASLRRILHTIAPMHLRQWRGRLKKSILDMVEGTFSSWVRWYYCWRLPETPEVGKPQEPIKWMLRTEPEDEGRFCYQDLMEHRFTFLNQTGVYEPYPDWNETRYGDLWRFNLHYFEYLHCLGEKDEGRDHARELIIDWMEHNPLPCQPAWHPYVISLRIINWIKFICRYPSWSTEEMIKNLYLQSRYLADHLEYHLGANHLSENGRALAFAGLFFKGAEAEGWFRQGMRCVESELKEQILPAGGHYERSPMYHCILLEGLLELEAYLKGFGKDSEVLSEKLTRMSQWLAKIRCPDGSFPCLNDAAPGICSRVDEILCYASTVLQTEFPIPTEGVFELDGLHLYKTPMFYCVIDGGEIGPAYNPGHAHADNFTYILFYEGIPLVVDPGTSTYEAGPIRMEERSTWVHNTVCINNLNQSEVWGKFRVGVRSNPTLSKTTREEGRILFEGEYCNRLIPQAGIVHQRRIILTSGCFEVIDRIQAKVAIHAQSSVLLAPDWNSQQQNEQIILSHPSGKVLHFTWSRGACVRIEKAEVAGGFGKRIATQRIVVEIPQGTSPVSISYRFSNASAWKNSPDTLKES